MRAMLRLGLILFAGCWGLLLSEEQVEWNHFLQFVTTYNKEYRDDSSELIKRFKIFKVTRDRVARGVVRQPVLYFRKVCDVTSTSIH